MKHFSVIRIAGVGVVAAALAWLATGCETLDQLTELGTGVAVAG